MSKPTLTDFIVEDVTALVHDSNLGTGIRELIFKGENVVVEDVDPTRHDANLGTGVAELVVSNVGESVEIQA